MNQSRANPAFWRALHSLAHPVSLAAIALLHKTPTHCRDGILAVPLPKS
ncbi:MAG: hypothetical protein R3E39_31465 [Anaerolineae bacterium]